MEYKAEDFISFIENGRRDKVSPNGLELIAKRFRELECKVNKLSLGAVSGRSEQSCKHPDSCAMGYYHQIGDYYCSKCQKTGLQD